MWTGSPECPECGYRLRPPSRMVQTLDGELVEIAPDATTIEEQDRAVFYAELRAIGRRRGYKPGWAAVNFKERFGEWPPRSWNGDRSIDRPAA